MEKNKFETIKKIERDFAIWIFSRRYNFVFLVLVVAGLFGILLIPYLNLLINWYTIILISLILAPFILNMEYKILISVSILLFVAVFILWVFRQTTEAENLTEYIFILLLSGALRSALS